MIFDQFGSREICDVCFKAKADRKIGSKMFYKGEPVMYFDTLKTTSLEQAVSTVYAQGGKGNSRLIAWDGEKTMTFTMEDALISPAGLSILAGADLLEGSFGTKEGYEDIVVTHATATIPAEDVSDTIVIPESVLNGMKIYKEEKANIYVMALNDKGRVMSEPFLFDAPDAKAEGDAARTITLATVNAVNGEGYTNNNLEDLAKKAQAFLVDFYVEHPAKSAQQIDITSEIKAGNFYVEASTLWRDTDGTDVPAEFVIPNAKVQSNFSFSMAASGDPSTFTFTMDAFPDYTRFNKTKKVIVAIQLMDAAGADDAYRTESETDYVAG